MNLNDEEENKLAGILLCRLFIRNVKRNKKKNSLFFCVYLRGIFFFLSLRSVDDVSLPQIGSTIKGGTNCFSGNAIYN